METQKEWPTLLTIPKAAEEAGVTKSMIRSFIETDRVRFVKSGRVAYINMDDLYRVLSGKEK